MNELSLFAGAGGGILGGVLSGFRTVCAVEKEPYCREVLLRRQRDGVLPLFPIWDDIRTFDGRPWRGAVDIVTAGFPCQPFSVAGKRLGADDERNLWPDTIRIIREVRPRFAMLENVPGLVSGGYLGRVAGDLAEAGYDSRWDCLSAAEVGAPHRRARFWLVADADGQGLQGVHPARGRVSMQSPARDVPRNDWKATPRIRRATDGLSCWVDRVRALGNAQVPRVAQEAWERLNPVGE